VVVINKNYDHRSNSLPKIKMLIVESHPSYRKSGLGIDHDGGHVGSGGSVEMVGGGLATIEACCRAKASRSAEASRREVATQWDVRRHRAMERRNDGRRHCDRRIHCDG
jgi:hypothetical protein